MPEKVKMTLMDMESIVEKNFNRIKTPLMSNTEMSICDLGKMIDILKDLSETMKNITKIRKHYEEHSDMTV